MKISKEELEKRLARESEIFSDYLYLARKMAKHDFTTNARKAHSFRGGMDSTFIL